MKNMDLLNAMGDIDGKYVEEAMIKKTHRRTAIIKWCATAACFLGIAGGVTALWQNYGGYVLKNSKDKSNNYVEYEEDIAMVLPWEERTITEQFPLVPINEAEYGVASLKVESDKIGELITEKQIEYVDEFTGEKHTTKAEIYAIKNISSSCAAAVKYEGTNDYYVCRNSSYKPKTLGQFITDLNLKENLIVNGTAFGTVKVSKRKYSQMEYSGLKGGKVWEMLLKNEDLKNVENYDEMNFDRLLTISIDVETLGYKNICLEVTEEGYLTTNILGTGKAFFIGKDKVNAFVNYVRKNCKATEKNSYLVDEDEKGISESTSSFTANAKK